MNIQVKRLADLNPAPYNPRKSDKKQEENLKASLEKFGVVEPIVFNERTGNIVGGHFRVRQLIKMGVTEAPCVVLDLSLEDEKELNIRLNANTGSWDWELLANDWDKVELGEWGLVVPTFEENTDFSDKNKEIDTDEYDDVMTIKLDYCEADYIKVKEALSKIAQTPEQAVFTLLGLDDE